MLGRGLAVGSFCSCQGRKRAFSFIHFAAEKTPNRGLPPQDSRRLTLASGQWLHFRTDSDSEQWVSALNGLRPTALSSPRVACTSKTFCVPPRDTPKEGRAAACLHPTSCTDPGRPCSQPRPVGSCGRAAASVLLWPPRLAQLSSLHPGKWLPAPLWGKEAFGSGAAPGAGVGQDCGPEHPPQQGVPPVPCSVGSLTGGSCDGLFLDKGWWGRAHGTSVRPAPHLMALLWLLGWWAGCSVWLLACPPPPPGAEGSPCPLAGGCHQGFHACQTTSSKGSCPMEWFGRWLPLSFVLAGLRVWRALHQPSTPCAQCPPRPLCISSNETCAGRAAAPPPRTEQPPSLQGAPHPTHTPPIGVKGVAFPCGLQPRPK